MAPKSEPNFADDFIWWMEKYADNPPPEFIGKFILVYGRQILHIGDTEAACEAAADQAGLAGKHRVIMAVSVKPQRESYKIG